MTSSEARALTYWNLIPDIIRGMIVNHIEIGVRCVALSSKDLLKEFGKDKLKNIESYLRELGYHVSVDDALFEIDW